MKVKRTFAAVMAALIIAAFSGCGTSDNGGTSSGGQVKLLDTSEMFSGRDLESGYDDSECTVITLSGKTADISGEGASANGSRVTITAAGDYLISGSLSDGCIIIDADKKDKVRLILNGVNINSSGCAAINVVQADKVFVTLAKGSENILSNAENSQITDDVDAVIFSKDDLTVNGEGSLTVTADTGHAIVCKDDLVISGGSYTIKSEKKALDANDSIRISGGSFTIDSGTDALHCENTDASKGYIYIADGTFAITAGTDGMDASGAIQIDNGTYTIKTGGGSQNASVKKDGGFNGDWGSWGGGGRRMSADSNASAEVTKLSASSGSGNSSDTSSAKGIKSDSSVAINNGAITIDSSDDAIHSDSNVTVSGGSISVSSGDDGMHAGSSLNISGGTIDISKSYEGLEGMTIEISGGSVSVTASDDGLNAAGGSDQSSMNGRPGQNKFAAQEGVYIKISGGSVSVNSNGDGIDSNGDVTVSGGETYVSGASDNGNAALDFNGSATVTGGIFVAAGMSGMAQNFGEKSTQGSMMVNVGGQSGGSEIILKDSDGKTIVSFTPQKNYNSVVISAPDVKQGGTYTLTAGTSDTSIKMDSLIYGSGGNFQNGGGMPDGGNSRNGGGMPRRGRR